MMLKTLMTSLAFTLITGLATAQQLGQQSPEISLKNAKGETVSLSSLKGKVVLLDFWASWCPPCRAANKKFAKLYKTYKAKGFEIYSVSVDSDSGKWQKAVKKDGISWIQVNDPGDWDSPTAKQWGINAIPTTYLIDKEGKLVDYDLEGPQLEAKIKELLAK